jgi:hypothetical protein
MTYFSYLPYFAYYTYVPSKSIFHIFTIFCICMAVFGVRMTVWCRLLLTSVTWLAFSNTFEGTKITSESPRRLRAVDMRHVLLVLSFLLDGLLDPAVFEEHNRKYPLRPVHDPSTELVGITILFIQWYMLYRRRYSPKDKKDVKELATLGDR